ncbi:hypothetical protein COU76_05570 [Candidatus Peregrinibacteria bacterium CG10_big_fil_rev_8_21_14_0_10_49_10]|nr:MAG: hypothetical protein COU76_05570 [Candidatus Peregrinibacteria bacterium CG10_big_fil_rev_8_21_14_0_10_49_10]
MRQWYYVYILQCCDGSYYTGITNDVERRVVEHSEGCDPTCYTFSRRPVELVHKAEFAEVMDAIGFEKRVKRWSRRKKEALIVEEYEKLPGLASVKNVSRNLAPLPIRHIRYRHRFRVFSVMVSSVEP